MEIVLFKIRTRVDIDAGAYEAAFDHMLELVSQLPGFIDFEAYSSEDGAELAVARFDSEESIVAWRDHPEHAHTRERGRNEFFDAYNITVATVNRSYGWAREPRGD